MTDEAPTPETNPEETASGTPDTVHAADETGGESPAMDDAGAEASEGAALEIGSQAETTSSSRSAGLIRGRIDERGVATGTGRRKTAVARVRISDGQGKFTVNEREFAAYFPLERDQQMIYAPLKATDAVGKVDVWVRVTGGGSTGQTGAVVLGIARALQAKYPGLHQKLSEGGYLTRDGRMVERKKYGRRKARRSFQFSKR
jgi:small subunit ribosomal protein S9